MTEINWEVDKPPHSPRKSFRRISIKNLPTLYKIIYIAPTVPVVFAFDAYQNKNPAIRKFPALESSCVGINGTLFGAKSEWV